MHPLLSRDRVFARGIGSTDRRATSRVPPSEPSSSIVNPTAGRAVSPTTSGLHPWPPQSFIENRNRKFKLELRQTTSGPGNRSTSAGRNPSSSLYAGPASHSERVTTERRELRRNKFADEPERAARPPTQPSGCAAKTGEKHATNQHT